MRRQLELWGEEGEEPDDEDVVPQELIDAVDRLDRTEYDVKEILSETFLDLNEIVRFLDEAQKFDPKHDDKLQKLIRLLKSKALADQKILIFTEFADTARYVKRHLDQAGIEGVEQVDSATKEEPCRRHPAIRALLQRPLVPSACRDIPRRDPRADLHRCPIRGPQPPGRVADDELRHPLEPGASHAAHRPGGPAHES